MAVKKAFWGVFKGRVRGAPLPEKRTLMDDFFLPCVLEDVPKVSKIKPGRTLTTLQILWEGFIALLPNLQQHDEVETFFS